MMRPITLFLLSVLFGECDAFILQSLPSASTRSVQSELLAVDKRKELLQLDIIGNGYKAGGGPGELAKRYGHLVGAKVKTVGQAFADFTDELGYSISPLYKNALTDFVGITHLIVVNARFQRDAIWCAGILKSLDLILKSYPDVDIRDKIYEALFRSIDMKLEDVQAEAKKVRDWTEGRTKEEVEAALSGAGDSFIADIARKAKSDDLWMYSRYFGIGLVSMMDAVGVEQDKDSVYKVMEDWMKNKLGKPPVTACVDSDLYFKVKDKIGMMETMMKEIEIREKKRMAERLEQKADLALKAAEEAEAQAAKAAALKDAEKAAEEAEAKVVAAEAAAENTAKEET